MIVGFNHEGTVYRGILYETRIEEDGKLAKRVTMTHKDGAPVKHKNIEYVGPILSLVGSELNEIT